jgi:hypothetical protein
VVAVATLWTLAIGTRIEDAAQQGVAPGQLRQPPTTTPRRTRRSGTARRIISLIQQGMQMLRWLLAHGRTWVRLWLRPEPWPKTLDTWAIHIHCPSSSAIRCLNPPPFSGHLGQAGYTVAPTSAGFTVTDADGRLVAATAALAARRDLADWAAAPVAASYRRVATG